MTPRRPTASRRSPLPGVSMPYCPECGVRLSGYPDTCPECGFDLDDPHGYAAKHRAGMGIASFVIGLATVSVGVVTLLSLGPQVLNEDSRSAWQGDSVLNVAAVVGWVSALLSSIGSVLGLVALYRRNPRKVFAVIGVILNVPVALGWGLLVCSVFVKLFGH